MESDTSILSLIAVCVGGLIGLVGGIMLLYAAFRESIVWGLVALFVPFGNLIFTAVHWAEAKQAFLTWLVGFVIIIGSVVTFPEVRKPLLEKYGLQEEQSPPGPDLSAQIAEKRKLVEDLQGSFSAYARELPAEFQQLEKRRKALKPGDEAAVAEFNKAAAAYQSKNLRHRQIQQEINAAQTELDHLLDERSRAKAKGQTAGGKNVVMYTTQRCPACKVAKQYMAQKGIRYQEIDVETSPEGRAEFQRLGGSGVPLIIVGSKRMEGFNSQQLDQMLL